MRDRDNNNAREKNPDTMRTLKNRFDKGFIAGNVEIPLKIQLLKGLFLPRWKVLKNTRRALPHALDRQKSNTRRQCRRLRDHTAHVAIILRFDKA